MTRSNDSPTFRPGYRFPLSLRAAAYLRHQLRFALRWAFGGHVEQGSRLRLAGDAINQVGDPRWRPSLGGGPRVHPRAGQ